ncbi:capsular polysaccharide transport system ATP-binding protein [Paraburkholderia sp. RAU2J]|uniref:ABC transporter ATP-binding protein n=1 Tax=Paraburkholderia sp. RAU2J TaxID=1938810 RepID=UPI000EAF2F75|nr:ABC transporter ATP-binding protein [Paraburkholderia sp. RAU2J]RKT21660.1 capsular polysaccharide transport system ATP-binding protein [Paraburkholderia sp. RAU2J]
MILIEDVRKRYMTEHGAGRWILRGITMNIPTRRSVALIGPNGAGKSTLLRIIGGIDFPTKGRVERRCRVSWPMGGGGLEGTLTGRQNAKFVCRVHGHQDELKDRLAFIEDFAELGDSFDEPVETYSSGMRSRLQFALSLAFDFEVFISDEVTAAGDAKFRKKAADAFRSMVDKASVIMVSHDESTLRQFCQSGILINDGLAYWFDELGEALKAYKTKLFL